MCICYELSANLSEVQSPSWVGKFRLRMPKCHFGQICTSSITYVFILIRIYIHYYKSKNMHACIYTGQNDPPQ